MFLISSRDQVVKLGNLMFEFAAGERIHTENSHKYEIGEFQDLARNAGFAPKQVWSDAAALFSVHYLEVE